MNTLKSQNQHLSAQLKGVREALASCRHSHLRELTEFRDKHRSAEVLEDVASLLKEQPVMFFEPTDYLLEEDQKVGGFSSTTFSDHP